MASFALAAVAIGFGCCLFAVAAFDVKTYTIPNSISVALLWLFVVSVPLAGADISLLAHFYSFGAVLAVGLLAFRFGILGGGDVKSWAAVAIWYDIGALPYQIVWVTVFGSVIGILALCLRWFTVNQYVRDACAGGGPVPRLMRAGEPIPYGIAIALGSASTVSRIDVFQALFP
jgi:prepilin peptidase CpaA